MSRDVVGSDPVAAATELAAELIRTASAFLRQTVSASAEAVLLVEADATITHASEGAEEMFGYSPGGMEGMEVHDLVPEELRELHRQHFADYLADPRSRPMYLLEAVPGQRRDGGTVVVQIGFSPILGGDQIRIVAVMRRAR